VNAGLRAAIRADLVRRGLVLNWATMGYNMFEAVASLVAGMLSGSVALVGFGLDSAIELAASGVAQWRLRTDHDERGRAHTDRRSRQMIGWSFVLLAAYIFADSGLALWHRTGSRRTTFGIVVLALSVVVMPLLARLKRRVAQALESRALEAEARQTSLCAYLSAIALAGVLLNSLFGWWWADPVAALAMVPIILREGVEGVAAREDRDCC
jgi:divalent metal cation (Fe/Co/Zn/Cd) transporter